MGDTLAQVKPYMLCSYITLASSHALYACDEAFFSYLFLFLSSVIIYLFFLFFIILDKFILKTWINRKMSYFLGILSGV